MKYLLERHTKKELGIVFVVAIVVLTVSTLPYLYGYWVAPKDAVFMGMHKINWYDTYTYLAWIEQGRMGSFFFVNLFSSEPQVSVFFHPLFLVTGFVTAIFDLTNIVAYHVSRFFIGGAFFLLAYIFISKFFTESYKRILAFILLATSSGVGIIVGGNSTDLWFTETVTFLNIYESPLNTFSLCLILAIFIISLDKFHTKSIKWSAIAAIFMNVLVLVHTYDFIFVAAVLGFYTLLKSIHKDDISYLRNLLYLYLFSFPAILWQAYVLKENVSLALWATIQSSVPAYHPINYLTGFGFLAVFATVGSIYAYYKKQFHFAFPIIWIVIVVILLYFPYLARFQRKFTEGLHIPVVLLATVGIVWWVKFLTDHSKITRYFLYSFVVLHLSLTNWYVVYQDIKVFDEGAYPYYYKKSEIDAIKWLKNNSNKGQAVLSGTKLGNIIPGISGRPVYMGYDTITDNYYQRYDTVKNIFALQEISQDKLKDFFELYNISYLVYDQEMKTYIQFDIKKYEFLKLVYESPDIKIYKIN